MNFPEIIGQSQPMQEVFALMRKVIESDSTVLILGESGTGKEMVARAIHERGSRWAFPLVTVNCGAIPEGLLESELFGHARGSFTGAIENHRGKFEVANHGTLFLDEIGDMSPKLQVKLLRVLQERKIESVGANKLVEVDVRVIAATHKDLEKVVQTGHFREDLYYRLNVIPIPVPPLRDRKADIPLLLEYFLKKYAQENQLAEPVLGPEVMALLYSYTWPGNVRELENFAERVVVLYPGAVLKAQDILQKFLKGPTSVMTSVQISDEGISFKEVVSDFENELIAKALERTGGNKNKAAHLLHLNRTTLVEKIKRLNRGNHDIKP
ncbi:MAG: sigma-54-dependent Fis family transcriptional regulator [Deltaproteobacteria bacterium]|nr:sigma-54-dependent Fis family transcriptional regulator [Deltaproteobacteria bacterium]